MSALEAEIHALLLARGETVATAESLTAGLVGAALTNTPGSSATYRGGLIVYATDLKASLGGVSGELLAERGPVDPDVAIALAVGVRDRFGTTWGLSLTGVAGPDPQDGVAVGTLYVGLVGPTGSAQVGEYALAGDRAAIRRDAVGAALALLHVALAGHE
jgi:nicotinamide-nucleotide amidase